jgi:hypothetical protein
MSAFFSTILWYNTLIKAAEFIPYKQPSQFAIWSEITLLGLGIGLVYLIAFIIKIYILRAIVRFLLG